MAGRLKIIPPVIAHRGASAYAPENTLIAFTKAAQMGVKWLEFDVMLAACDTPIIFHDETLFRVTNTQEMIADHAYSYLRSFDIGKWFHPQYSGERIPSLNQVLEFLSIGKLCANIEIKPLPGQDKKTAELAYDEVVKFFPQPSDSILFSSFSIEALKALRRRSRDCLLGLLLAEWVGDWEDLCEELDCVSLHIADDMVTPQMVERVKERGVQLLSYTVNEVEEAKQFFKWGVSAVFSDYPDKIMKILKL